MLYVIYVIAGLAGGVLTGMAGLTAAMVLTPILCGACGWPAYDATTIALIANVPSAMVTSCGSCRDLCRHCGRCC